MRLVHKFLAANVAVILPVVVLVGLFAYRSVERGFLAYVGDLEAARLGPAAARLGRAYAAEGSWAFLLDHPERWDQMLSVEEPPANVTATPRRPPSPRPPPPPPPPPPPRDEADPSRPPRAGNPPPPPPPRNDADPSRPPRGGSPPPPPPRDDDAPSAAPAPPGHDPLEIPPRAALFDKDRRRMLGAEVSPDEAALVPVEAQGRIVGYIGLRPIRRLERELDLDYLSSQRRAFVVIAAAALTLALAVSLLLGRHVLSPIRDLTFGTERLRSGAFDARIDVRTHDELGLLARDFNALAQTLGDTERARKQWLADTSHELRTPLAVLRALIEAVQDGVRPATPETFASLHAQVQRLSKLVDDIHDLARLDGGLQVTRQRVDPIEVLRRVFSEFEVRFAERDLDARLDAPDAPVLIEVGSPGTELEFAL